MERDSKKRLCAKHLMLPVLIEPELIEQEIGVEGIKEPLVEAVRKRLQDLVNEQEPIPDQLLHYLLKRGRVLVIIDRFSEMRDPIRKTVVPNSKTNPFNALIVTSRTRETPEKTTMDWLEPLQLKGSELVRFMEDYLKSQNKKEESLLEAASQLEKIVDNRPITAFLAKLYIDQLITVGNRSVQLPKTIPDLMISCLERLNTEIAHQSDVVEVYLDNNTVCQDAKTVAWECLRYTYRPNSAKREVLLASLAGDDPVSRLNYLEKSLRIVETVGEEQSRVRFTLDPLAEYLAGLYLIEQYKNNLTLWQDFLKTADTFTPEAIQGFILAIQDCCFARSAQTQIPESIVRELRQRTALVNTFGIEPKSSQQITV
ncbi:hypothetical protein C7B82_00655 [Stenomitos frigidus ULC18]|uniref:NACHT C-terminal Helical domain-containing protein n=2 Tax=Stenomitos TaxID=1844270 RepID=A0A2T1ESG0_9CYAN|nr:hypothetical protein C7B82_00655 [Stenomitos frigidus ULC18]